jgi:hypothetical protein
MNCAITGSRGVLGRKFISLYNKKVNFIEYKGDITNRKKIINWMTTIISEPYRIQKYRIYVQVLEYELLGKGKH